MGTAIATVEFLCYFFTTDNAVCARVGSARERRAESSPLSAGAGRYTLRCGDAGIALGGAGHTAHAQVAFVSDDAGRNLRRDGGGGDGRAD